MTLMHMAKYKQNLYCHCHNFSTVRIFNTFPGKIQKLTKSWKESEILVNITKI